MICVFFTQKLEELDFGERKAINKRKQQILEGKVSFLRHFKVGV